MSRINNNIIISVDTTFISNKSVIQNDTYVFSYSINIFNKNSFNIQLLSRYWNITDSNGNLEDDSGEIEDREVEDEKHGRERGLEEHRCQDCQDVQRQRSEEKHLKLFQFNFKFSI